MSARSKLLTWGLPTLGLVALIGGTSLVVVNRPVSAAEEPPRPPTTAPLVDASDFIGAIGTSEPAGEAIAVAAHIAGVVEDVAVRVGQTVARGDLLFQVDDRQARSMVELRRSQLDVARAELASLRASVPPRRAAVRSAEAAVASAQAEVSAAEADLSDRKNQYRIASSVDDARAISMEEVDRRRFAMLQAQAQVERSQAAVQEADARLAERLADLELLVENDGSDGPDVLAAAQRVGQARRDLERAEVDLELLSVRTLVDGRVLQVNVRPGEFAPASVPAEGLVVLGRNGTTYLRVEIDEVDIPRFDEEASAWASPRGQATQRYPLTLAYLEPLIVPKTNLAGRTSELIDTRVLQAVYRFGDGYKELGLGQQFDVYIEARTNGEGG